MHEIEKPRRDPPRFHCRLPHHRVAVQQGGRDLAERYGHGVVPRRNGRHHPQGPAANTAAWAAAFFERTIGSADGAAEQCECSFHLGPSVTNGLAYLPSHLPHERIFLLLEEHCKLR